LKRQAERQRAILASAVRAVQPGGFVLYSTCSLEPEENEQVIEGALPEGSGVKLVSMRSRIEALRSEGVLTEAGAVRLPGCITDQGGLKLIPGVFQTDGFFAALMEKER
jgi:16S rRNA (cytosine967-C5)-methyltransferase